MAKKEEPIADSETGKIKVKAKANKEKQPDGNETKGNVTKVKAKMKKQPEDLSEPTITKVDLSKPVEETKVEELVENTEEPTAVVEEIVEEVVEKPIEEKTETPVVEEITSEVQEVEEVAEVVEQAIAQSEQTGQELPDSIQKLMFFMEETGGDLTDYVTLNQDFSELDNHTLLTEYYKSTKPHLSQDEIEFVMEDTFSYDEEVDEDREIKRKKLAMKEQVAQAKLHLESVKSKYYEDIKSGAKLTREQQEAIEYFNTHNEESEKNREIYDQQKNAFESKTNSLFNDKFKGFEYNIGEKKFRFNVKDTAKVKETQSDINNFIKKFLTKENTMKDAVGYHKGLFTAMNPDQVANHFYEQGKADALKQSIAKSKNVSMDPRQAYGENVNTSGLTVRALDNNEPDFKFKIKNNKFKK
tara:strand:- start:582 stop:1823 length:1242 start_codon:yes stop_codon:yes gene_type:complete